MCIYFIKSAVGSIQKHSSIKSMYKGRCLDVYLLYFRYMKNMVHRSNMNLIQFHPSIATDGPREAVLSPDNNTTNLDEGQNLGPISCSADCNPTCTIQWRFNATMGHGKFVDQTTQNGVLQIVNVRRSMAGVYRCLLQNKVDYNRKDVSLNVLCKYQRKG
ncbi:hypothetical protein FSP39_005333 [Pinctada imbricata]|uniref:Ig-like domain-containing protein n=1 Tax=Pinctada imbricata TaxID=66713 RepID=A0AA89C4P9_PINIB|nr:hypothetical protein FSP39_005333 [Pinctada imbricata]